MSGVLQVTKNEYFTYIKDGGTEYVFRDNAQVWNTNYLGKTYEIHVSGPNLQPNFAGTYNCFAKKHLMTIKGGKSSDPNYEKGLTKLSGGKGSFNKDNFDRTVRGKLFKLHDKRTSSEAWERGEKFTGYQGKRTDIHGQLDATSQPHYQQNALGATGIKDTTPLTVVLCDRLDPDDLKDSFAAAIAANLGTNAAGTTLQHVPVTFRTDCVYQHDAIKNDFKVGRVIKVSIYLHRVQAKLIEAHVVHCSGT